LHPIKQLKQEQKTTKNKNHYEGDADSDEVKMYQKTKLKCNKSLPSKSKYGEFSEINLAHNTFST
jgi:hypothetical protein